MAPLWSGSLRPLFFLPPLPTLSLRPARGQLAASAKGRRPRAPRPQAPALHARRAGALRREGRRARRPPGDAPRPGHLTPPKPPLEASSSALHCPPLPFLPLAVGPLPTHSVPPFAHGQGERPPGRCSGRSQSRGGEDGPEALAPSPPLTPQRGTPTPPPPEARAPDPPGAGSSPGRCKPRRSPSSMTRAASAAPRRRPAPSRRPRRGSARGAASAGAQTPAAPRRRCTAAGGAPRRMATGPPPRTRIGHTARGPSAGAS
mmetsp:Transcript_19793/g.47233  ORF Transcript_19793/g.47233 Transcript_19793/m.47233 type:complete len:260 (-) Transcript_19793:992-1771(-)